VEPVNERIALHWAFLDNRIAGARNYWVCTSRPDHRPHAAPVWGVWHGGELFFGTDPASVKARNIERFGVAAFHLESAEFVVSVEGAARVESDETLLRPVVERYNAKYALLDSADPVLSLARPLASLYVITPRVGFSWLEAAFGQTMTRWEFAAVGADPQPVEIRYG
jgi:hypothetical protein